MVDTVDTGHGQISRTAVVEAPIEELHAIIVNPHRHGELDGSGMVGTVVEGADRMQVGEPFKVNMKMFGVIPYKITSIPIRVEPNVVEWQSGPSKVVWRWELEELSPNQTRVTETWDTRNARVPMMEKLMGGPTAKGIEQSLKNLQAKYIKVV